VLQQGSHNHQGTKTLTHSLTMSAGGWSDDEVDDDDFPLSRMVRKS
jgi:hypothetical protein